MQSFEKHWGGFCSKAPDILTVTKRMMTQGIQYTLYSMSPKLSKP